MGIRFALLTSLGAECIKPYLDAAEKVGLTPVAILIDGVIDSRTQAFVSARFDRSFRPVDLTELDLPHVPSYFVRDHNSPVTVKLVKDLDVDYLVNAGTPRIIKAPLIEATQGIINCHPGLLPAYRGCTCVEWSLYNGDPVGATSHLMVPALDEGPIILSETMRVEPFESYELIRTRMIFHQAQLFGKAMQILSRPGFKKSDLKTQGEGRYYKPIPIELLLEAKSRLLQGMYKSPLALTGGGGK